MSTLVVESFFKKTLHKKNRSVVYWVSPDVMMTKHIEMFDDLGVIKRGLGQSFLKIILTF